MKALRWILFACLLFLALPSTAPAAVLALYEFGDNGLPSDEDNYSSSDSEPGSVAGNLLRGAALGSGTSASWPNPTSATTLVSGDWRLRVKPPTFFETPSSDGDFLNDSGRAYTGNSYLEFTLTPSGGAILNLDSFTLDVTTTNSRFFYYYLSSNIDGFDTPIGSVGSVETSSASPLISLSDARFQNLGSATTFRLYVWGNQGGSSGSSWTLDGIRIDGTAVAVPEPQSLALASIGLLGLWFWRRLRA